MTQRSYSFAYIQAERRALISRYRRINGSTQTVLPPALSERVELLKSIPDFSAFLIGWQPTMLEDIIGTSYGNAPVPLVMEEAVEIMAFALGQFQERAEAAGTSLVILSTYMMGTRGSFLFDQMRTLAHRGRSRSSTSMTTSFVRVGRLRTPTSLTTSIGVPPAIGGRRKPCSNI